MSTAGPQTSTPQRRSQNDLEVDPANFLSAQERNSAAVLANSHLNSANASLSPFQTLRNPNSMATFHSTTIAPSPPSKTSTEPSATLPSLDTSERYLSLDMHNQQPSPLSAGLRIQTDIIPGYTITAASNQNTALSPTDARRIPTRPIAVARTPSVKKVFASSISSNSNLGSAPNSALSSPMLNAMADVTPLPSPLLSSDSPGPWNRLNSRPCSRDIMISADAALVTANGESISSAMASQSKRRAYHGLTNSETGLNNALLNKEKNAEGHNRNRSVSEYVPGAVQIPKLRHTTVSGSHAPIDTTPDSTTAIDTPMRREPHLAGRRGKQ
ncbi:hypothetical protein PVAG01_09319 [Phlyctema vagabunda]|uniref:Uncharacterized protein n=1 Tax=Phlyctema vagabunda TaxID=108571 RepID=A0ABR4P760_9HELO